VAWLLASGAAANLVAGRGPFALGIALAAGALLARRHRGRAIALALLTAAASPLAGLFLCLAGAAMRSPRLVIAPAVLAVLLVSLFPEGGAERFVATAFWPMLALTAAAAALVPGRWRVAAVFFACLLVAAFALRTPVGQNAARLGVLAGPALLAVAGRGPKPALILVGAGLLYLQLLPAVRAIAESRGDPATTAAFHAPLLAFLDRAAAPGDRVEIAFTRNHWEAAHVAPRRALARGWERQLDLRVNGLFYDGRPLTAERYERWLRREGIRWVALPAAPLDFSALQERALLESEPGYLRRAFESPGWRVWELRDAPTPVDGPGRIVATGPQRIELRAAAAGRLRLRTRHSRFWRVTTGRGRVVRSRDGRLLVDVLAPGRLVLRAAAGPG